MSYLQIKLEATESANLKAKRARHSLSSGLSFIQTAITNISSNHPDIPRALKLHAIGSQKLRKALEELDELMTHPDLGLQEGMDHEIE